MRFSGKRNCAPTHRKSARALDTGGRAMLKWIAERLWIGSGLRQMGNIGSASFRTRHETCFRCGASHPSGDVFSAR